MLGFLDKNGGLHNSKNVRYQGASRPDLRINLFNRKWTNIIPVFNTKVDVLMNMLSFSGDGSCKLFIPGETNDTKVFFSNYCMSMIRQFLKIF